MIAVPRVALRRVTMTASPLSSSRDKPANIGTDFRTVVETEVDRLDMLRR